MDSPPPLSFEIDESTEPTVWPSRYLLPNTTSIFLIKGSDTHSCQHHDNACVSSVRATTCVKRSRHGDRGVENKGSDSERQTRRTRTWIRTELRMQFSSRTPFSPAGDHAESYLLIGEKLNEHASEHSTIACERAKLESYPSVCQSFMCGSFFLTWR